MHKINTTEITEVIRLRNSVNGNPCYRVVTPDGSYRTATDSICAYVLSTSTRGRATLEVDERGQIRGIEVAA